MKKKIDFEKAFKKGRKSYDTAVGDWWERQAENGAHLKAYRAVADFVRADLRRRERAGKARAAPLIVDYACGGGHLLRELALRMPEARIVGMDGSPKMLERARLRLEKAGVEAAAMEPKQAFGPRGPRVRLLETTLPNFSLPKAKADAVIFLFPNLTPAPADQPYYDKHGYLNRSDTRAATVLARLREMDPEDEIAPNDPEGNYDGLMTERVIARHARSLLRRGSPWYKIDYANAAREELSALTRVRSLFSEGALEEKVKDARVEVFFRYLRNEFRRSQVILDVYHQTKDPTDKTGGYFVTVFEAV